MDGDEPAAQDETEWTAATVKDLEAWYQRFTQAHDELSSQMLQDSDSADRCFLRTSQQQPVVQHGNAAWAALEAVGKTGMRLADCGRHGEQLLGRVQRKLESVTEEREGLKKRVADLESEQDGVTRERDALCQTVVELETGHPSPHDESTRESLVELAEMWQDRAERLEVRLLEIENEYQHEILEGQETREAAREGQLWATRARQMVVSERLEEELTARQMAEQQAHMWEERAKTLGSKLAVQLEVESADMADLEDGQDSPHFLAKIHSLSEQRQKKLKIVQDQRTVLAAELQMIQREVSTLEGSAQVLTSSIQRQEELLARIQDMSGWFSESGTQICHGQLLQELVREFDQVRARFARGQSLLPGLMIEVEELQSVVEAGASASDQVGQQLVYLEGAVDSQALVLHQTQKAAVAVWHEAAGVADLERDGVFRSEQLEARVSELESELREAGEEHSRRVHQIRELEAKLHDGDASSASRRVEDEAAINILEAEMRLALRAKEASELRTAQDAEAISILEAQLQGVVASKRDVEGKLGVLQNDMLRVLRAKEAGELQAAQDSEAIEILEAQLQGLALSKREVEVKLAECAGGLSQFQTEKQEGVVAVGLLEQRALALLEVNGEIKAKHAKATETIGLLEDELRGVRASAATDAEAAQSQKTADATQIAQLSEQVEFVLKANAELEQNHAQDVEAVRRLEAELQDVRTSAELEVQDAKACEEHLCKELAAKMAERDAQVLDAEARLAQCRLHEDQDRPPEESSEGVEDKEPSQLLRRVTELQADLKGACKQIAALEEELVAARAAGLAPRQELAVCSNREDGELLGVAEAQAEIDRLKTDISALHTERLVQRAALSSAQREARMWQAQAKSCLREQQELEASEPHLGGEAGQLVPVENGEAVYPIADGTLGMYGFNPSPRRVVRAAQLWMEVTKIAME
eukprot:TRINITY_DN12676_c0_g1_i1.p1 TRINITY_DN12676_c0_g1~~TRINITY_DN12676_c0_g1_i1.p1  ORF type:complete len:936 (-),score=300.77 TRINITY_DN12676_c0_g1_i1:274-3081(-)